MHQPPQVLAAQPGLDAEQRGEAQARVAVAERVQLADGGGQPFVLVGQPGQQHQIDLRRGHPEGGGESVEPGGVAS